MSPFKTGIKAQRYLYRYKVGKRSPPKGTTLTLIRRASRRAGAGTEPDQCFPSHHEGGPVQQSHCHGCNP